MAYPKKHLTNWFTTSGFRAINLALVTDIAFRKTDGVITSAMVYQAAPDGDGQASFSITEADARKLFDILC